MPENHLKDNERYVCIIKIYDMQETNEPDGYFLSGIASFQDVVGLATSLKEIHNVKDPIKIIRCYLTEEAVREMHPETNNNNSSEEDENIYLFGSTNNSLQSIEQFIKDNEAYRKTLHEFKTPTLTFLAAKAIAKEDIPLVDEKNKKILPDELIELVESELKK